MLTFYLVLSTISLLLLGFAWSRRGFANFLAKVLLITLGIMGFILVLIDSGLKITLNF